MIDVLGKMSQYLDAMVPGDKIDVRGPSGRLQYKRNGVFEISIDKKTPPKVVKAKRVGMIAGEYAAFESRISCFII